MFHFFGTKVILFSEKEDCFFRNLTILAKFATLHIHLHAIHLKYTHIAKLPDFVGVQQFHFQMVLIAYVGEVTSESHNNFFDVTDNGFLYNPFNNIFRLINFHFIDTSRYSSLNMPTALRASLTGMVCRKLFAAVPCFW